MGSLLLALLIVGLGLGVLLYAGSLFLQGYIYTEPSSGLAWQAPAAAAAILLFLGLWCLLVANSATAAPSDVPYDTLFRFSHKDYLAREPVGEIVAILKNGKEVTYKRFKLPGRAPEYLEKKALDLGDPPRSWNRDNVKAIRFKHNDQDLVFELQPTGTGANRQFVNAATGYTVVEFDAGPDGRPFVSRWSNFVFNLFLNFFHLALWFACFWLLLRYQWGHGLGLGLACWLIVTVVLLPMLLDSAAEVAVEKRSPQGRKAAEIRAVWVDSPRRVVGM